MIWLNDIRWKYFTNEKAGLIFKELTKEFRIVYKMTENKRYEKRMNFNVSLPDERCFKNEYCIVDEAKDRYEALSINELVDRLNEQEETIQGLKTEVLDLQAEVGRLNCKKEIEKPHWLKYESSKGYTRQVNQDIRFKGDAE